MSAKTASHPTFTAGEGPNPPPQYSADQLIELGRIDTLDAQSTTSLPTYEDAIDPHTGLRPASPASAASAEELDFLPSNPKDFVPTLQLQIETSGRSWWSNPFTGALDPVPVFRVGATLPTSPGASSSRAAPLHDCDPAYISYRFARGSSSSYLVRGDDPTLAPLATTTYRFGPGKPPIIRLIGPGSPALEPASDLSHSGVPPKCAPSPVGRDLGPEDSEFEVVSRGLTTRAQLMRTPYGSFAWRYADRHDRAAIGANSLLVLERVTMVAVAGSGGKTEEHRVRVAQFVRNAELRTPGTGASYAGNGGRLSMDLRQWADTKGEAEMVERIAVTSCLTMLKKEVDRRRMHQHMIIFGGGGGGP